MTPEQKSDNRGFTCRNMALDSLVVLAGSGLGGVGAYLSGAIHPGAGVMIGGSGAVVLEVVVRELRWSLAEDRKKKNF